jgi:N-acetylglucosamine kinase-like BadF-type ATPase
VSGAAAALPERAGVALFAGTGSFAMARDAAGGLHRIGGRGNRVSDHGSGYRVVLAAAEAVFLADQGMAPAASARLRAALCDGLGVTAPLEFGVALRERSAAEVARCFGAVVDAAAAGDAVADLVLTAAVDALAAMARAAARVAGLPADAPIVLGGGTMRAEPYRSRVVAALGRAGCGGAVESLAVSPAMGAAFLARAVAAAAWSPLGGWVDG